jgi:hypothetical protein
MAENESHFASRVLSREALGPAQRLIESAAIALITSTGLYLVGSVYVEAYFGRMSIDATSLDLPPPFIAMQSAHVLQSLLEYPTTLLFFYVLYRAFSGRMPRLRAWYDRVQQRVGRLFLLLVNLLIVSPLLAAAARAGFEEGFTAGSSVLGEVAELMTTAGVLLFIYLLWLSLGPRLNVITEIQQRKLVPIALIFLLYLLDALVATARGATTDAEILMMGASSSSIEASFTFAANVRDTLPDSALILVIARNGHYYVVERQSFPPDRRPVAYAIPFDAVDSARLQRVIPVNPALDELPFTEGMFPSPVAQ